MKAHRSGGLWLGLLVSAAAALLAINPLAVARVEPMPPRPASPTGGLTTASGTVMLEAPATPGSGPQPSPTAVAVLTAGATPTLPSLTPSPTTTPASPPSPGAQTVAIESAEPVATAEGHAGLILGYSVQGRPILAQRVGEGPIKVVLIGDIHGDYEANTYELANLLLDHFAAYPEEVPAHASLWVIPTMNPDGLATGHRWNANDVDLNRNADTDLDGCAGNDWSPDTIGWEGDHLGAGGAYPFSEPETRAVRDFLADAWVAVFYHSAAGAIFVDTCQRHAPSAELARALSLGTSYPIPEDGWAGYPITGDMGDYLAGEGVASVTVELVDHQDPEFERNLQGVRALLQSLEGIVAAEANRAGAQFVWLDESHVGTWHYPAGSFLHPLSVQVLGDTTYLLDGGRVLALDLRAPEALRVLLSPGDQVGGVTVLEPLDLAADGDQLLVLDRAADVYTYDALAGAWTLERVGRPSSDTYDHYYIALDAAAGDRVLLDTTHERIWRFASGQTGAAWVELPQSRDVDLTLLGDRSYVLTRALNNPTASIHAFLGQRRESGFRPNLNLMHPRQLVSTADTLYVLDRAGRRLSALDAVSGDLQVLCQFPDRRAVSAVWADPSGDRLILAGRDALYFLGEPSRQATIEAGPTVSALQPHNVPLLEGLRGLQMPITGASITSRDFQMPGAPRHYRLGVHEGIDFYGHTVGVTVNRKTEVRAIAAGTAVRATLDYEPLTEPQAAAWAEVWQALGYTPPEVLDGYRGRQVWIEHEGGLVSRYAHLGSIAPGIVEGVQVTQGQVIATVGNSGTPDSLRSNTADVHLHLELWLGDHYVGQFLRPIEAREWIERMLR